LTKKKEQNKSEAHTHTQAVTLLTLPVVTDDDPVVVCEEEALVEAEVVAELVSVDDAVVVADEVAVRVAELLAVLVAVELTLEDAVDVAELRWHPEKLPA
jgi:hypothetical protein